MTTLTMDYDTFSDLRSWLEETLNTQGAKRVNNATGIEWADSQITQFNLDIELKGKLYNIGIKPCQ